VIVIAFNSKDKAVPATPPLAAAAPTAKTPSSNRSTQKDPSKRLSVLPLLKKKKDEEKKEKGDAKPSGDCNYPHR